VGYYLGAEGRAELERVLQLRFGLLARIGRRAARDPLPAYLGLIALLSVLMAEPLLEAMAQNHAPLWMLLLLALPALSQGARTAGALPDSVANAFRVANVPTANVAVSVVPLSGPGLSLALNETAPMNPASTMKLVTTLAALELLGPQFVWRTDALAVAPLVNGALEGDLFLRGSGDPRFVIEHL
jgi:D-alanyl-D-alanine carboxypeptidase